VNEQTKKVALVTSAVAGGLLLVVAVAFGVSFVICTGSLRGVRRTRPTVFKYAMDEHDRERVKELESRKLAAENAAMLKKLLLVRDVVFTPSKGAFDFVGISATVENKTTKAIATVVFRATLTTPGRTIPWVDTELTEFFRGGLEHGETANLNLDPGIGWIYPEDQEVVLSLEVVKLRGAKGKELFGDTFSEFESQELRDLKDGLK